MDKIGKYEIVGQIGTGGFGTVYKGWDPFIKRFVAIKTCSVQNDDIRRRFMREAEIGGNLHHPHIVTVHDLGAEEGIPYLVQEYLPGEDLDHVIQRKDDLTEEDKLDTLIKVARGLEFAHEQGVVHRDVKPANVRILDDGQIKIMDFGIAKLNEATTQLTQTGTTMGTAAYLSPEQITGGSVDGRADIFSFGVVAFELFTYDRPFRGDTFSSICYQILHEDPRQVSEPWKLVRSATRVMVERCLEKDPAARYPDFGAVVDALKSILVECSRERADVADAKTTPMPFVPAKEMKRKATAARARKAKVDTAELISQAEGHLAEEQFQDAEIAVRQVLEVEPGHQQARDLLAQTEAARQKVEVERERLLEIQRIESLVGRLLDEKELDSARRILTDAEKRFVDAPEIAALKTRLEKQHKESSGARAKQDTQAPRVAQVKPAKAAAPRSVDASAFAGGWWKLLLGFMVIVGVLGFAWWRSQVRVVEPVRDSVSTENMVQGEVDKRIDNALEKLADGDRAAARLALLQSLPQGSDLPPLAVVDFLPTARERARLAEAAAAGARELAPNAIDEAEHLMGAAEGQSTSPVPIEAVLTFLESSVAYGRATAALVQAEVDQRIDNAVAQLAGGDRADARSTLLQPLSPDSVVPPLEVGDFLTVARERARLAGEAAKAAGAPRLTPQAMSKAEQLLAEAEGQSTSPAPIDAVLTFLESSLAYGRATNTATTLARLQEEKKALARLEEGQKAETAKQESPDVVAIRGVLSSYERAYGSLDVSRVRQVLPNLSRKEARALRKRFSEVKSLGMELKDCQFEVQGVLARVSCRQLVTAVSTVNQPLKQSREVQLRLQKLSAVWTLREVVETGGGS